MKPIQTWISKAVHLAFLILPVVASGGVFQYECEVREVRDTDRGTLEIRSKRGQNGWREVGQKFTISRQTGDIVGAPAYSLNRAQGWKEFRILDPGSPDQAYKFLAVSNGPYTNVTFIQVKEFEKGEAKTFLYLDSSTLTVGVCK